MQHSLVTNVANHKKLIFLCIAQTFIIFIIGYLSLEKVTQDLQNVFFVQHKDNNSPLCPPSNLTCETEDRPGQMGSSVQIPTNLPEDILEYMELDNQFYGFHKYQSDFIGYHRSIPDQRFKWCKTQNRFHKNLPSTSIIIPVYNEAWSTLVRTVNSIIINSPPELIHEIILVVDLTDLAHLKTLVEDHFINFTKSYLFNSPRVANLSKSNPPIKILHTNKEGLIQAKNLGAQHATGEVLTFLDSHCECTKGWLQPLLDRIARNSTTVTLPTIDYINKETFEYSNSYHEIAVFNLELQFRTMSIPRREIDRRTDEAEPFYSPIMLGSMFSISRAFFEKLGGYDGGLKKWGGENLEISLKVWMCGGRIEGVPCSHVGHIFAGRNPLHGTTDEIIQRNLKRIAEVWMDPRMEEVLKEESDKYKEIGAGEIGDLSVQKALREKLKCKSFDWYLKKVYPELLLPEENPSHGDIKNEAVVKINGEGGEGEGGNGKGKTVTEMVSTCIDSLDNPDGLVGLYPCHGGLGNQNWLWTKAGEIRQGKKCLDYFGEGLYLYGCHSAKGNQHWKYFHDTQLLVHSTSRLCLAVGENRKVLVMKKCDVNDENQSWTLENYDSSKLIA